jgi:hypothetical protein
VNAKGPRKTAVAKQAAPKSGSARRKREPEKPKGKAWTFPQHILEDAVRVAQAIEEKHAGNPMHAADLAKAIGFRQPTDWRFLNQLRSANQYGLIKGSGPGATISLEKLGQDIVAPSSPQQRQQALRAAFINVPDFENPRVGGSIPPPGTILQMSTHPVLGVSAPSCRRAGRAAA